MRGLLWLAVLIATPVLGQGVVTPDAASAIATAAAAQSQAAAAQSTAAAAQSTAAAAQAAIPPACSQAPATPGLTATIGTGAGCTAKNDAAPQTPVQAANTTLNADCTWTVTFQRMFLSSVPVIHAEPQLSPSATQPLSCSPTSRSNQVESGKCFQSQTATLAAVSVAGVSVAVGAQQVNPTASSCTAGTPIMVWGREPTQ